MICLLIVNNLTFWNVFSCEDDVKVVFPTANAADVAVIQEVCNAVSNRAARLAAAGNHILIVH